MRDHAKLDVFHLSDELAPAVYAATPGFPRDEQFGLTARLRRAAVSIPSNIVEGCGRASERDYLRFLDIAFGSLRKLTYQVSLAQRLAYLSDTHAIELSRLCNQTSKALAALIRARRRRAQRPTTQSPKRPTAATVGAADRSYSSSGSGGSFVYTR